MDDAAVGFASLEPVPGERFVSLRRQLVNAGERVVLLALGGSGEHVGRDGRVWASWDDDGGPRTPQEVPLPEDLPLPQEEPG